MTTVATPAVMTAPTGFDAKLKGVAPFQAPPTPPLSDDEREVAKLSPDTEPVVVEDALQDAAGPTFERRMGDTELSYYLPSRADGVNDMYLHLGFRAPVRLFTPERVRAAWALFRLQHPPLAARVVFREWEYTDVRFAYTAPSSVEEALVQAGATLELREDEGKDVLLERYLNGPRTLSNDKLAYLVLSTHSSSKGAPPPTPVATPNPADATAAFADEISVSEAEDIREFDLLICAAHFLGDGMALHRFANEFFTLLSGNDEASGTERTTDAIVDLVRQEWEARWGAGAVPRKNVLPPALEDGLPAVTNRFKKAAGKIDFELDQKRQIGGHAFPKRKNPSRHTVVPTVPFDTKKTKAILKKCKENGVSVANALFALSDVAWIRVKEQEELEKRGREHPLMMYSALNLRPYLLPAANAPDNSYWFVAVGYFNVVLPAFLPSPSANEAEDAESSSSKVQSIVHKTFWHRARVAKKQSTLAGKHPMLVSRTREMALLRGRRARTWAREDDEKAAGVWVPPAPAPKSAALPTPPPSSSSLPATPDAAAAAAAAAADADADAPWKLPPAPSAALVGLSLLGNLDGMYKHAHYPALGLHTLTTGSRQRAGAMLMFGYTFAGRLWLSLGYDENGFADGVVERWWSEFLKGVDEFLVD